jgi:HEAT repeats
MTYRRALLLVCLPLLGLVLTALSPFWRPPLIGLYRGESTYQGRYTNEWRADLQQWEVIDRGKCDGSPFRCRLRRPPFWNQWLRLPTASASPPFEQHPLMQHDPASVPVLLDLLHDPDPEIRLIAIEALEKIGPDARAAVPVLFELLDNEDQDVSEAAEDALFHIDYEKAREEGLRWGKERFYYPERGKRSR